MDIPKHGVNLNHRFQRQANKAQAFAQLVKRANNLIFKRLPLIAAAVANKNKIARFYDAGICVSFIHIVPNDF